MTKLIVPGAFAVSVLIFCLALPTDALSQAAPPPTKSPAPGPAGPPPAPAHTFALTDDQWNVVFAGLDELPGKFGRPVRDALLAQIRPVAPAPAPPTPGKKP